MRGNFTLMHPRECDAARIAEIHLAAMDSNPLLHAQFPTPESLAALKDYLTSYTAEELRDLGIGVLIARDYDTGVFVGFVKWELPSSADPDSDPEAKAEAVKEKLEKLEKGGIQYLEGCRPEYLERYAALAEEAKARCFGNGRCYRLSFVCTDPAWQGRGVGSLLTRYVTEMAAQDGLPVYLESTEVAVPMYEKLGFKAVDGFEMEIPSRESAGSTEVYKEWCMVWYPPAK